MILGILSDTHGQAARAGVAVRLLQQLGAESFVHCGDVGAVDVLDELAGLDARIACGNVDSPTRSAVTYAASLGLRWGEPAPLKWERGGRKLLVFHGHEPVFGRLMNSGGADSAFADVDYIFHGHTHVAADYRVGPWRVINPGALQRAAVHTVATLDLARDELKHWVVDGQTDSAPQQYELD